MGDPSATTGTGTGTGTTPLLHQQQLGPWWRRHLRLRNPLSSEISGAVGDLGTYIPIVITLTLVSHLDLSTTLIFTALYNIATGLLFGVPMPVQPMKSIAAVAVTESPHLSVSQIAAAGLSTAAVLLVLGATGLMSFFYRYLRNQFIIAANGLTGSEGSIAKGPRTITFIHVDPILCLPLTCIPKLRLLSQVHSPSRCPWSSALSGSLICLLRHQIHSI